MNLILTTLSRHRVVCPVHLYNRIRDNGWQNGFKANESKQCSGWSIQMFILLYICSWFTCHEQYDSQRFIIMLIESEHLCTWSVCTVMAFWKVCFSFSCLHNEIFQREVKNEFLFKFLIYDGHLTALIS